MNDYFYLDAANNQKGPISPNRFADNGVTPDTLVWCQGLENWTRAAAVDELKDFFRAGATSPRPEAPKAPQAPPPYNAQSTSYDSGSNNSYNNNSCSGSNSCSPRPWLPCPETNLVWGILTTIFCFMPFGIVSIVYASKVNNLYLNGQYEAAVKASDSAKKWALISLATSVGLGVIIVLLYIFFFVTLAGTAFIL